MSARTWRWAVLAAVAVTAGGPRWTAGAEEGTPVLVAGSPWRWHITVRKPTVPVEALRAAGKTATEPAVLPVKLPWTDVPDVTQIETAPPPETWRSVDFDDSDWPRSQAPFETNLSVALFCARGRFLVTDPAAVKGLSLSLTYRGGAVIYLNGTEVARTHLPAGPLTPTTPAEPYPDDAYLMPDGKAIPPPNVVKTEEVRSRVAKRVRTLGPVDIPTSTLRKGVNVLAVECHRSDYHPIALTWWNTSDYAYGRLWHWIPNGLLNLSLAATGAGVEPNIVRPEGLQVWTADIHDQLTPDDHGDPQEGVQPIRITGARNGFHSGVVVMSSTDALKSVSAQVGDLLSVGGTTSIPSRNVQVRYVVPGGAATNTEGLFDGLTDAAPAEVTPGRRRDFRVDARRRELGQPTPRDGAVLPIWVTVHVPKDAAPGDYRGELALSAEGLKQPIVVPVELHVADWTVPDPRAFRTHAGIFQSPTSVALQYGVPEWSEQHWRFVEKSLELLGAVGNNLVNIPISDQTQFGNDEGMLYFIRKADGTFDYDFTVFDRYVGLVKKHLGTPKFVALHVWHAGAWQTKPANEPNTVTVVDPATGKREHWQVPVFGTEASRAFWKPFLAAARERLAQVGLDGSMCIGILSDGTAPPEVFRMFDEVWPGGGPARWTRGCHSVTLERAPYALKGGGVCVYHEFCYGGGIPDPAKTIAPFWSMNGPGTDWRRGYRDFFPGITFRRLPERGLYGRTRGFGRLGLDLWTVPVKDASGRVTRQTLFNRYPFSSVAGHGEPTIFSLAWPAPDGPRPTVRLELVREGMQEAEAMIAVGAALDARLAQLGPDLAAECRRILVDRIEACRLTEGVDRDFFGGWRDRSRRAFDAAAKVANK